MPTHRASLTDLSSDQLRELVAGLGQPAYRAGQLQHWLFQDFAWSYNEMRNLPGAFRARLAEHAPPHSLKVVQEVVSQDGTVKALLALDHGGTVESTLMPYPGDRYTVCLSTQVGCAIGCPFCATGQQGFERNLTAGEIIDQVLYFARQIKDKTKGGPAQISNLVFMGMGEPLANFRPLWQAIGLLNAPDGFGLGARNMTISTAGLVPQIRRLGRESLQVGLAVSLHAAENALRNKLVPLNRKYPLEELIPACREYIQVSGRRVTFEYILFEGVNDSLHSARALGKLLSGLNCHVNLIAANLNAGSRFRSPGHDAILTFEKQVREAGINCTLRRGRGLDIAGGCGQLRSRVISEKKG